jgi:hypothetical protein
MADHPWVIGHDGTHGQDAYAVECLRCGQKQRFALPIDIGVWCAAVGAFGAIHGQCKPKEGESDG